MSSRIAVVPGSFDPPTLGHLDVIRRAASLYDQLHVLVVHNPGKEAMLPIAQRQSLLEQSIAESDIDGEVIVASWSMGLLVDYATDVGASVLVKGIRSQVDVAYETPMAIVNRHLAHVDLRSDALDEDAGSDIRRVVDQQAHAPRGDDHVALDLGLGDRLLEQ